jgi:hypothetical protein
MDQVATEAADTNALRAGKKRSAPQWTDLAGNLCRWLGPVGGDRAGDLRHPEQQPHPNDHPAR